MKSIAYTTTALAFVGVLALTVRPERMRCKSPARTLLPTLKHM